MRCCSERRLVTHPVPVTRVSCSAAATCSTRRHGGFTLPGLSPRSTAFRPQRLTCCAFKGRVAINPFLRADNGHPRRALGRRHVPSAPYDSSPRRKDIPRSAVPTMRQGRLSRVKGLPRTPGSAHPRASPAAPVSATGDRDPQGQCERGEEQGGVCGRHLWIFIFCHGAVGLWPARGDWGERSVAHRLSIAARFWR